MKRINFIILIVFLFVAFLSRDAFAEPIPEQNIINKDLNIEREENIIEFNKRTGNPNDNIEIKEDLHLLMTKDIYLKKIMMPSVYIIIFSVVLFCTFETYKFISKKRSKADDKQ